MRILNMSQIITIANLEATLIYEDGSTWFVGTFSSQDALNNWVNEEKTRPYWQATTQVQVVDKSYTVTIN
jgi:hypothetical protein